MNFDMQDLRLFISSTELGSFTACAKKHFLALAAVSKRMQHLEEQIGTVLFNRSKKGVELTRAGVFFLEHAQQCLRQANEMAKIESKLKQEIYGQIRLLANTTLVQGVLPDIVGVFLKNHPYIDVLIQEKSSNDITGMLLDGQADIGIFVPSFRHHPDLAIHPFFDDHLVVVCQPNNPLAIHTAAEFQEVLQYSLITLPNQAPLSLFLQEQAKYLGKNLQTRIETSSFDGIFRFVRAGAGISIVPLSVCQKQLERYGLIAIPLVDAWSLRHIVIATKASANLSEPMTRFLGHIKNPPYPFAAN